VKDEPFGVEFADIDLGPNYLTARGVAVAGDPTPYRLDYTLETAAGFVTSRLHVVSSGEGWRRSQCRTWAFGQTVNATPSSALLAINGSSVTRRRTVALLKTSRWTQTGWSSTIPELAADFDRCTSPGVAAR